MYFPSPTPLKDSDKIDTSSTSSSSKGNLYHLTNNNDDILDTPLANNIKKVPSPISPSSLNISQGDDELPPVPKSSCIYLYRTLKKLLTDFIKSLKHPFGFLIFNIICIIHTIVALTYYIKFFLQDFYIMNSSGMPPTWAATIPAFACVFVTTGIGPPLPPYIITKPYCIAVIIWEFIIFISLTITAICLGHLEDYHGMGWSIVGAFTGLAGGIFLLRFGIEYEKKLNEQLENPVVDQDPSISINEITLEEGEESNLDSRQAETTADQSGKEETKSEPSRLMWIGIYFARGFLCVILFVFAVIPSGFGVGEALIASERNAYKYPGTLYSVPSSETEQKIKIRMHLHCTGSISSTKPTILIEGTFGESGYLYMGLQSALKTNWRTCIYDRAGYGWSDVAPMGSASPTTNAYRLNYLLTTAGELSSSSTGTLILIGHKEGGEMMQVYANIYPSRVAGLALLDSYLNIDRLKGTPNNNIAAATKEQCDNWNIGRALESCAIMRIVNEIFNNALEKAGKAFTPVSNRKTFYSTQNNGNYYPTQYSDLCFHSAATQFTDYLTSVGTQSNSNSVKWPQIASNLPVYIVSSSNALSGQYGTQYTTQLALFISTLSASNTISSTICSNCYDTFPYDSDEHIAWLANQLDTYFKITYP